MPYIKKSVEATNRLDTLFYHCFISLHEACLLGDNVHSVAGNHELFVGGNHADFDA